MDWIQIGVANRFSVRSSGISQRFRRLRNVVVGTVGPFRYGSTIVAASAVLLSIASDIQAAPLLFDMGTATSDVWEGFTRITAENLYIPDATSFGWHTKEGLKASVRAYKEPVENKSRGRQEPPPMWTNPITEDSVSSDRENSFLIKAAPGDYEVYVLCGSSDARREQYFDFTVEVNGNQLRAQFEGPYQFRAMRFRARVSQGPLAIRFFPKSRWVVNALLFFGGSDADDVQKKVIEPLQNLTWGFPPEEWAKWKQDPEPDPGPVPPFSDTDRKRGFAVFSRPYLECVYPHTNPRPEELNPELRIFATPGEFEPLNFIVHPLDPGHSVFTEAKVTVSDLGPVRGADVDVRRVAFMKARPNYTVQERYRIVPDVLERFNGSLPEGENVRFWLTVHVPEDAKPGLYHGTITFSCTQSSNAGSALGGSAQIPVQLRILPFHLSEDPSKIFGIYYHHPYDRMRSAPDEASREHFRRVAELEHADMVAHGTRNVVLSIWSPPADAEGKFKFDWDLLAEKIALGHKHGFTGPIVMGFNTEGIYEKYMKERPGSHLRAVKDPPPEFSREVTAMVAAIETERKARSWPEFLYYPIDEPSTDPVAVRFMVTVLQACRAAGVRTYVTADPTHEQFEPLRPFVDVWCTQPFAPDRETVLADTKARKVEYWCYPNHVNGENDHTPVTGARMTYGFGFWRSGFHTLIPWIYSASSGDPNNYLDGSAMDFFNRHEADGTPVPVAMWEAYREGWDDHRYIYTLEQLITAAKRSGNPAATEAAAQAARELRFIWDSIRVQAKYKDTGLWSPAEFNVYRWLIAQQILELQEVMRDGKE